MSKRGFVLFLFAATFIKPVDLAFGGFDVSLRPTSCFNTDVATMDTCLGVGGAAWLIDDFEDTNLIAGLDVVVENHASFEIHCDVPGWPWDGTCGLWSGDSSVPTDGLDITLNLSGNVRQLGIGIGGMADGTPVSINGQPIIPNLSALPNWTSGQTGRNGYLLIEATGTDTIDTVFFSSVVSDSYYLDHVAVMSIVIPAVSTWGMLALVLCVLVAGTVVFRRREAA